MARGWKRAAELLVARSRIAAFFEHGARPTTVILTYHNVVPRGEDLFGDAGLHVDQEVFADQLDFILEGRDVVSLAEAIQPAEPGPRRTRVAITFDDAYVGCMTAGLEEVTKRDLPATVFVPPGELGSDGFWWDRLARPGGHPLEASIREQALGPLQGKSAPVFEWAAEEGLEVERLPEHACPVSAEDLAPGKLPPGITLGAHTWSHPNLAALPPDEVASEMSRSRDWLTDNTDRYVDWLAYPYGLHDDGVVDTAADHFEGALRISGGAAERRGAPTASPHRLPRVDVGRGLSLEGLALRLGGML